MHLLYHIHRVHAQTKINAEAREARREAAHATAQTAFMTSQNQQAQEALQLRARELESAAGRSATLQAQLLAAQKEAEETSTALDAANTAGRALSLQVIFVAYLTIGLCC
jgi:phage-related minor tail protein